MTMGYTPLASGVLPGTVVSGGAQKAPMAVMLVPAGRGLFCSIENPKFIGLPSAPPLGIFVVVSNPM